MQATFHAETLYSQLRAEIEKHPHLLQAYKTDLTIHDQQRINGLPAGAVIYIMAYDYGTHAAIHPSSAVLVNPEGARKQGADNVRREAERWFSVLYRHMVVQEGKSVKCYHLIVEESRLGRAYGQIKEIHAKDFARVDRFYSP